MSVKNAYNFREVTERVSTSGQITAEQLGSLAAEGFEAMINLLPHDSQYAIDGEPELVAAQGLIYHYIPVDFVEPNDGDFQRFAKTMDRLEDKKIMIHCAANYRVSAFYGLYAFEKGEWDVDRVRAFIADIWDPAEYPQWQAWIESKLNG